MLNYLRALSHDARHQGTLFEKVMKSFFKTDKLSGDFKNVWMWNEYPKRNGRGDLGVDLVAEDQDGKLCAIQTKFRKNHLTKQEIDSFIAFGSRNEFDSMILVTTAGYSKNAEYLIEGSKCKVLDFLSLAGRNIDWPDLARNVTEVKKKPPQKPKDHQKEAIKKVLEGLKNKDRGILKMACGTGKTLVALKVAEKITGGGNGGLVLYSVPSISLMRQSIRYWSDNGSLIHKYVGVCSDAKVGNVDSEDIPLIEMEIGVTTDPRRIACQLEKRDEKAMTVVFSTYQSMDVIVQAQKKHDFSFDLVLCDEAHRTTGVDRADSKSGKSAFQLVHGDVKAKKRLYMTATPKIYSPSSKTKAKNMGIGIYTMDDEDTYGQELYKLSFSDAVDQKLLSDYRVVVLSVDEKCVEKAGLFSTTKKSGELRLENQARVLGMHNVFRNPEGKRDSSIELVSDGEEELPSIQTGIVYTNKISYSREFAEWFNDVDAKYSSSEFKCEIKHVDGTQNSSIRSNSLQWLRDSKNDMSECRVLSNARCLSEGVDVPNLSAVCFLNPKSSQIDIIQAVGRVMRKSEGKRYGYVILPIAIPASARAEEVLDKNGPFQIVWNVLNALRSHDDRMEVYVNTADLCKKMSNVNFFSLREPNPSSTPSDLSNPTFPIGHLNVDSDLIYSKIVERVGDKPYFEQWRKDIINVVGAIEERIRSAVLEEKIKEKFDKFVTGLKEIINDSLTFEDGISMIAQHIVTRRIFKALFGSDHFIRQNPVSLVLEDVVSVLRERGLERELKDIGNFYASIEKRVAGIENYDSRKQVIDELYGDFFKKAFPKTADRLGIVYTPKEIVDFILRSVDFSLRKNFDLGITNEKVNVIDPFTGTGAFLSRLMSTELGLVRDQDITRKYNDELFANEIVLLAYYIAAVSIESMYNQRTGQFKVFEGISLTDTFQESQLSEHSGDLMAEPKKRIRKQRELKITVVLGNPPYSVGQKTANEENQNLRHPRLERRIKDTYTKETRTLGYRGASSGQNNTYIKAIRWASDRIGESGVIGFVTPSGFITSNSQAGMRACLKKEFSEVYCFDLRGDKLVKGEQWRKEGNSVFDSGTRTPVAITILVKNPVKRECKIYYKNIGDYLDRDAKLDRISEWASIENLPKLKKIIPNEYHDWLNQRGEEDRMFKNYPLMGNRDIKRFKTVNKIFESYSGGITTRRDEWIYNASVKDLEKNMRLMIDYCKEQDPDKFVINPKRAAYSEQLKKNLKRSSKPLKFNKLCIRVALYKPFIKNYVYLDSVFISSLAKIPSFFPVNDVKNITILVPLKIKSEFSAFITNLIPDFGILLHTQCFPMKAEGARTDNITNWALKRYRSVYEDSEIEKTDIFYYIYGMLHHPKYRTKYQKSLVNDIPHIPFAPDFWDFSRAGKKLADLHLNYEVCLRYSLGEPLAEIPDKPRSIRFEKGGDESTLYVNNIKIYDRLPEIKYKADGLTPVGWLTYRPKKAANGTDRYPFRLMSGKELQTAIERLVYVGTESDKIIENLPEQFEMEVDEPEKDLKQYLDFKF